MVVSHQRAQDWLAGGVVVPDRGGQGEDALQDADRHTGGVWPPCRSRSSWPLKVSLTDSMIWRRGLNRCAPARGLAFADGPQQPDPGGGDGGLEAGAVVVLVADEGLAGPRGDQVRAGGEHACQHVALVGFGAGQGEGDGQPCSVATRCSRSPQK